MDIDPLKISGATTLFCKSLKSVCMLVHLHFSEKLWGGQNTVAPLSLGILEPYEVLNELEANDFAGLATDHEIFA